MNEPNLQLTNNTRAGRWEARVDGTLAGFLRYRSVGGRTVLVHTEVDPAFEGRGVGSALARGALEAAAAALSALGPQATLDRGYAIVRVATDGRILRDPVDAPPGSSLEIRVARGGLSATVDGADGGDAR